jgi:hypothetical protein
MQGFLPRSALRVDETCKLGKEANSEGKEEEMKILILASLVIIIVLLAFIALMIYALGDRLSQK